MIALDQTLFYWKISAVARRVDIHEKNLRIACKKAGVVLIQRGRAWVLPKAQLPDLIQRLARANS